MIGHDPSEGVHASRILPNFDRGDPADQTIARLIILIEQMLTRTGVLPNYHTAVVGRRRDQLLAPLTAEDEHRIN